jgi:hypothetical protein
VNATRATLLAIDPPAIKFGKAPFRRGREQTEAAAYVVTAFNTTGETITLDDIRAEADADFPIFSGETTDTAIPPGGSLQFRIGFRPHHVGDYHSTVHLIQRGVSVGRVQVEATALDESDHWEVLGIWPRTVKFPGTAVGEESVPKTIRVNNRSGIPVRIEDIAPTKGAGDQFTVYQASPDAIPPGEKTELSLAFRPTRRGSADARFVVRTTGDERAKDLAHGEIEVHGTGLEATEAREDAVRDGRPVGAVTTYEQMLASLQAAQRLTDAGAYQDTGHTRENYDLAEKLLVAVAARMDDLAEKLPAFANTLGFASTTARQSFGFAHDAVKIWAGLLRGNSTINATQWVGGFEQASEVIRVLTGEQKDAPTLRAVDRASRWTPLEIGGATLGGATLGAIGNASAAAISGAAQAFSFSQAVPSLSATLAAEWANVQWAWSAVSVWALSHPEEVHDLTMYLSNLGLAFVDAGGLHEWMSQIHDAESFANVVGMVAEGMLIGAGGKSSAEPEPEPVSVPTAVARASRTIPDEPKADVTAVPTAQGPHDNTGDPHASNASSPATRNTVLERVRGILDRVRRTAARTQGAQGDEAIETAGVGGSGGPGAASETDEAFAANRRYESSPKHGGKSRSVGGKRVAKEPADGAAALEFSFQISSGSPRRVGVDVKNNEIVILDRTGNLVSGKRVVGGVYHGHVRSWEELDREMRKVLLEHHVVDSRGRINVDPKHWTEG